MMKRNIFFFSDFFTKSYIVGTSKSTEKYNIIGFVK